MESIFMNVKNKIVFWKLLSKKLKKNISPKGTFQNNFFYQCYVYKL